MEMADAVTKFPTNIDLRYQTILNQTIEEVSELPSGEGARKGRIVYYEGDLWMHDGTEWRKVGAEVVTQWSEEPSDEAVPSEKLVKDTFDAVDSELDSVNGDIEALQTDMAEVKGAITDIEASLDTVNEAIDSIETQLAEKTDKTMAIPLWEDAVTYPQYATVIHEGFIFISQTADNTGYNPAEDDGTHWMLVQGMGGSGGSAVRVIGDGTSKSFSVQHGFGTYNVVAVFRRTDGERDYVDARYSAESLASIRVEFTEPPSENGIVVIMFCAGQQAEYPNGKGTVYAQATASDTWYIEHNFNSNVIVQTYGTDGHSITGQVVQGADRNSVTVTFSEPLAGMALVIATDDDDVYVFGSETAEWVINHGKGRMVAVQTYDNLGNLISGDIIQDIETLNSVTVAFNVPKSGYAVIL